MTDSLTDAIRFALNSDECADWTGRLFAQPLRQFERSHSPYRGSNELRGRGGVLVTHHRSVL